MGVATFNSKRQAAIGPWTSYTPTYVGLGTVTSSNMFWRRSGDSMHLRGTFVCGTPTAVAPTISLPGVYSIDTSKITSATLEDSFGVALSKSSGANAAVSHGDYFYALVYNGTTTVLQLVFRTNTNKYLSNNASDMFASGIQVNISNVVIPISQFGADAVFSNSRVEYVYNSDTTNADDTTSFAYGSVGGLVPVVAASGKKKRIRFQSPVQATDRVHVEVKVDGLNWAELPSSRCAQEHNGTNGYGMSFLPVNSTDFDVVFAASGTYDLLIAAKTWTQENSAGTRWRVVKCANPLAVETAGPVKRVTISWEASSGTAGGNSTSGSWRDYETDSAATMTLNDPNSWGFVTLSSGDFILQAGRYLVRGHLRNYATGLIQSRIYNNTASAVALLGDITYSNSSDQVDGITVTQGELTLAGTTTFQLEYRVSVGQTNGLGSAASWGTEKYAEITIDKVA